MVQEKLNILTVLPKGRQLRTTYLEACHSAKLEPLVIEVGKSQNNWLSTYARSSGVLLLGGYDLNPSLYGEEPLATTDLPDDERYALESQILRLAFVNQKPILGVCLGAQTINVALGGSLYQSVSGHQATPPNYESLGQLTHTIHVTPDSHLAQSLIIGNNADEINVNSMHHQAIREVSKLLKVTAKSNDNIIEAIEAQPTIHPWLLGVQFHPEADPDLWPIFGLFAQAVNTFAQHAPDSQALPLHL